MKDGLQPEVGLVGLWQNLVLWKKKYLPLHAHMPPQTSKFVVYIDVCPDSLLRCSEDLLNTEGIQ